MFDARFLPATCWPRLLTTAMIWTSLTWPVFGAEGIEFDVDSVVPAYRSSGGQRTPRLPDQQMVRLRLQLSARGPLIDQRVSALHYTIRCRGNRMLVADYSPSTQLYSRYSSDINVTRADRQRMEAGVGTVKVPPISLVAQAHLGLEKESDRRLEFTHLPEQELMLAAGTTDRQRGVYFRFAATPLSTLEGVRNVELELEVPADFRAGLLEVDMQAVGPARRPLPGWPESERLETLARERFLIAVYASQDAAAAALASDYADAMQRLLETAQRLSAEIDRAALPNPLYRIGHSLDVIAPKIPDGWLEAAIFAERTPYPEGKMSRLPIEVRQAMIEWIQQQRRILALINSPRSPSEVAFHEPAGS
jgi:hypothetical protein